MKDFYKVEGFTQCKILIALLERLGMADAQSLQSLAEQEGKPPDVVWTEICSQCGAEPCTIPEGVMLAGRG